MRGSVADPHPLDWLVVLIASWAIPLRLVDLGVTTYIASLLFWLVPVLLLLPRFFRVADPGGRRRRAVRDTIGYIFIAGAALDLLFGAVILRFGRKEQYVLPVPALGGEHWIPIEELLFYFLGGFAIVLVYFWADEFWLVGYNLRNHRPLLPANAQLIETRRSPAITAAIAGGVLVLIGMAAKWYYHGLGPLVPYYYTFIVAVGLIPAFLLYNGVRDFVNWRAFSFTALYVLLTSCIWEVTLAFPSEWWGYRERALIGKYVEGWGHAGWPYPIEGLLVWIIVTFSVVLTYEAVKAFHYDERATCERLFGPRCYTDLDVPENQPRRSAFI